MWLFYFLDWIIYLLPLGLCMAAGRFLGGLFFYLSRRHRRIAIENLKRAFPEYPMAQIRHMARGAFQHLPILGIEVLKLSRRSPWQWRHRVQVDGRCHLEKAQSKGKSVLFLTGHVGNWEILAYLGKWAGFIDSVIARGVKGIKVQNFLNRVRSRYGVQVISKGQVRHIIQEFKDQKTVGALIDQDGGYRGTFIPFFGRPASTPAGVVRLGLRSGIPILPVFLRRTSGRLDFRCWIGPDISEGLESLSESEQERTALERFSKALENFVREDPSQWLWLHRRWKTRPPGDRSEPVKRILILSDAKAGHLNQLMAVTDRMPDWERCSVKVEYRSRMHRTIFFAAAYAGLRSMRLLQWALKKECLDSLPVWAPSVIFSCGSAGAAAACALKSYYGSRSVSMMRSGFPNAEKRFDLVILPVHDRAKESSSALVLKGIPTMITEEKLSRESFPLASQLNLKPAKTIAFLIGGHSNRKNMKSRYMQGVVRDLGALMQDHYFQVLFASSRRTPREVEVLIETEFKTQSCIRWLWAKDYPENPIPGILGLSDIVIVTEDSFSMLVEAVHSGRKVLVLELPRKGLKNVKYAVTIRSLEEEGRLVRVSSRNFKNCLRDCLIQEMPLPKVQNIETEQVLKAILDIAKG